MTKANIPKVLIVLFNIFIIGSIKLVLFFPFILIFCFCGIVGYMEEGAILLEFFLDFKA